MSTITRAFTKEQLIEHIKGRKEFADECAADSTLHPERREYYELTAEALRIALASIEAEPVCYLTWHQGFRAPDDCEEYVVEAKPGDKSCDGSPAFPVYTALPAPVSVTEWKNEQCMEFLSIAFRHAEINGDLQLDDIRLGVKMVNGSRAAMLQGAENTESRCTIQTAPALDSSPKIAESRCSNSPVIGEGRIDETI
jgi:hypothetical protein